MLTQESEVMLSDRWNSSLFKYVLTLSREPFTQTAPTVTKALKDLFQNLTLFVHTNIVKIVYFHITCHAYKISLFLTLRFASCIMAENLEWQKCSLSRYLPAIFNEQLFSLVSWPIVSACVCTPRSHYLQRRASVLRPLAVSVNFLMVCAEQSFGSLPRNHTKCLVLHSICEYIACATAITRAGARDQFLRWGAESEMNYCSAGV